MSKKKMDALGDRMKSNYENRTRLYLPRRTFTIARIDGKAFHTYTKGLKRPFDSGLIEDMDLTAAYLCQNIQGVKLAFVQSDEISLILTDFDTITTDSWFDGNIQKMASVSASMTASKFNQLRLIRSVKEFGTIDRDIEKNRVSKYIYESEIEKFKLADFDSRFFTIPQKEEVLNYLIFRQRDTVKNSVASVAQSLYSHNELMKKNQSDMQEMIFQKGFNWNDFPEKQKRGRLIMKVETEVNGAKRNKWVSVSAPDFDKDNSLFYKIIK